MQNSPCEIKEKLLRALDKEYNVVDMATVLEVISSLEKAIITRETLEKTRIGKYINELRKRTHNEQLARRAKELVKSWRKLLPQTDGSVNGERVISNIGTTIMGPGPGPGFGPGPGPGNKFPKTTSPSVSCERSTSPFCSSASNSPQFTMAKLHVSNKPSTPSSYAPAKLNQAAMRSDKSFTQNRNTVSSQILKPVSPALSAVRFSNSGPPINTADSLPQPLCISPTHLSSPHSCSPHSDSSAMKSPSDSSRGQLKYEDVTSPRLLVSSGNAHSSLEIAKTNVANKRLRKNQCLISKNKKKKLVINDSSFDSCLQNGIVATESSGRLVPSESSAFKSLLSKCTRNSLRNSKREHPKGENLKLEKQKRASDMQTSDLLKEKLSSLSPGTRLPKVKTTQQLIEELQARKDALSHPFSKIRDLEHETDNFSWKKSHNDLVPNAELLRSKSELLKKFLSSSPESPSINVTQESPVTDRVSSPLSDNVPSKSSVITSDKDFGIPYTDPISVEIDQILSSLPPINPEEINLHDDDEPLPERKVSVSSDDLARLSSECWECVNGNYSADGSWKPWQECTESVIAPGEVLRILPYVNID